MIETLFGFGNFIWENRKQKRESNNLDSLVIPSGLEPEMSEPKSDVLPLHHGTILQNTVKRSLELLSLFPFLRVQRYYLF